MLSKMFLLPTIFATALLLAPDRQARADEIPTLELELKFSQRIDRLDWNIAGDASGWDGLPINVLSELTWRDIKIQQIGVGGKVARPNRYQDFYTYLRGELSYGRISDGNSRDSDYAGNDRTREFSRSVHNTGGDHVLDAALGLGLQWRPGTERFALALLAGYSLHEMNLRLREGVQVLSRPDLVPLYPGNPPAPGAIVGLDSSYRTRWRGPWAGIDLDFYPTRRFALLAGLEYHWAEYRALADWNLRVDLAHPLSFRHDADNAEGVVLRLGANWWLSTRWTMVMNFNYQRWQAGPGTDRVFFAGGGSGEFTRLNEVNWTSAAAGAGLSYRFP